MQINDFYFVSSGCAATYLNRYFKLGHWAFDASSCLLEDFIRLIDNYNVIDYDDIIKIPYSRTRIVKNSSYTWHAYNQQNNIRTDRCFAYLYAIRGSSERIERFYKHYEDTPENTQKVNARIQAQKSTRKLPFFVWQPGMMVVDEPRYDEYLHRFLTMNYPYKLALVKPCYGYSETDILLPTDCVHDAVCPLVNEKLRTSYDIIV